MNRDEKRSRPAAIPPAWRKIGGHRVIYPSEPGGGTWIALDDSGVSFALINWYSVPERVKQDPASRGRIIPSLARPAHPQLVEPSLRRLPLDRINPFRLVGVFPASREIFEWRWDLNRLVRRAHPWISQQWISSGYDEPGAQQARGEIFQRARTQTSAGSLAWLRRLHRSHAPRAGPFSTCMHRADAVTVSYTEIVICSHRAELTYYPHSPCCADQHSLSRASCVVELRAV